MHPYAVRENWNVGRRQDRDQAGQDERPSNQMVGKDKKFGWGMFPTLVAKGPSKETPKLPEGEDIK